MTGSWLVPGVLAGVGVVGVGVGVGLGLSASGKKDDVVAAAGAPPCDARGLGCESVSDAYSSGKTQATISVVGYAVGGTALVGAVVYALVDKPWKERPRASIAAVPWLGGSVGGMMLSGRF